MKRFKSARKLFGDLDAEHAGTVLSAAADVSVVIDAAGIVRDVAFGNDDLAREVSAGEDWLGRPWAQCVTAESRPKIEGLLEDARSGSENPRWRQVNHPAPTGPTIPVLYSAALAGPQGRIVAFGRDLRAVSALQQKLVDAQQTLEREYTRLRHAETRYRLLFQTANEAVLMVDLATLKIVEANPACDGLLGGGRGITGRPFTQAFHASSGDALQLLAATARSTGRPEEVAVLMEDGSTPLTLSCLPFRQDGAMLLLVRIVGGAGSALSPADPGRALLLRLVENAQDAMVVTDAAGAILVVNRAFVELAQVPTADQAIGQPLDRWLGRPGVDMNVLLANLRQHGSLRQFSTTVRGDYGVSADVEISAVSMEDRQGVVHGFTIRNVLQRVVPDPRGLRELPRSVSELTELVGRVSLKELVRESTDVIERLCIEAALELTSDNRASAAEMLGLSRQSLYVKLRRYGLGDLTQEEPA